MKRVILAASLITAAGFGPLTLGQNAAPAPALPSTSTAQPMAVLLEQGVYQEETAGNLDAAAKAYAQIAAQAEVTRGLAAQALLRLALVQAKQKQMEEAQKTVARLVEEYPERNLLAKAQQAVPAAVIAAAPATEAAPPHVPTAEERDKAAALMVAGWKELNEGQYRGAQQTFAEASKLVPDSSEAHAGMGWAGLDIGASPTIAIKDFQKAIELDPKNASALNGLGWANYKNGQTAEAKDNWLKALEVDPKATSALSGLAKYASETGRYEEAQSWYEKWLKEDPQNADANIGLNKTKQVLAGIKDAVTAANDFLKNMDDGEYEDAYHMMSSPNTPGPPVPIAGGLNQWVATWRAQRAPLGKMVSRTTERAAPSVATGRGFGGGRGGGGAGGGFGGGGGGGAGFDPSVAIGGRAQGGPNGQPGDTTAYNRVSFIYTTKFEHKKALNEELVVMKDDTGDWHVTAYAPQEPNNAPDPLRAH